MWKIFLGRQKMGDLFRGRKPQFILKKHIESRVLVQYKKRDKNQRNQEIW
mgnify:CR=1 FL=1